MDIMERKKLLLSELKEIEKEEKKALAKEAKAEQRKKNDFCKKEFGRTYNEIVRMCAGNETENISEHDKKVINVWNEMVKRYNPVSEQDLVNHILSDKQIYYYQQTH